MKYLLIAMILFFAHSQNVIAAQNTSPGGPCCSPDSGVKDFASKNVCIRQVPGGGQIVLSNNCMDNEVCNSNIGGNKGTCVINQRIPQTGGATGVKAAGNRECSDKQVPTAIGCINFQTGQFATQFIQIGIGIGSGIAFLMIIFGSYVTASSQGIPDGINKGKDIITSAIIGLVFIILSVTTMQIIGFDILGLGSLGLGVR